MAISTRAVEYSHAGTTLEGTLAFDDAHGGKRPTVLISHAWAGCTRQEISFAKKIAELGYASFALDLYGKGVTGSTKEECNALMTPLASDRPKLQSRIQHALDVAQGLPEVDAAKIVAMGFCFGGLCVLDLARSGADIKGVASFHGILSAPGNTSGVTIKPKIIAYHGWDDPMVPPKDVVAFCQEMTEAKADWRLLAHGGAMHAFMNTEANDPDFGTVYNRNAADRSWASFLDFLKECFG